MARHLHIYYEFDYQNQLLGGEFITKEWSEDNFNDENLEVIDPSIEPLSSNYRKVRVEVGELKENTPLSFDISKYFISSLGEVYVSSYSNPEEHKNECVVGSMIDLYLDSFTPQTALDSSSYKIISSSNPQVIGKEYEESSFYYALSEGTSELKISNPFNTVVKTINVTVTYPSIERINLYCSDKELYVGDSTTINVSSYPSGSKLEYTVSCDNPNLIDYSISNDLTTITATAKVSGSVTLTVQSSVNPEITTSITLEIIEKPADLSWIIGTWKFNNGTFDCTMIFKDDFTGSLEQDVNLPYNNTAEFEYSYDGTTLSITNWVSDEDSTTKAPKSITVNEDKTIITIVLSSMDDFGDYVSLTMVLEKEKPAIDTSWLIGTWTDEDDGFTFVFNNDFTGTIKSGASSAKSFTWEYDGTSLTFGEWNDLYIYKPEANDITIQEDKTRITIKLEDDFEYYTAILVKTN